MSSISACAVNYTTPCAPCYIAAWTTFHSFPYDLTTIEVEATPYIYPDNHGSSSTSWKYNTLTQTLHASSMSNDAQATGTGHGILFDAETGVTWTTRNLTLTYPTTYIEYKDFSGVGADIANKTACAESSSISPFAFASETVEMSFVMPWKPTSTERYPHSGPATSLPPEILSYMDTFPAVTSQLGGQPIESCQPVSIRPACTTPRGHQTGICSTGCITGVPTSTMFHTDIGTSVHPASIQTFTAYSGDAPSYSYSSFPETTVYETSISSTTFFKTKGNYSTISCWTTCAAEASSSAVPTAPAFTTIRLTTASVLTTIKKDPIFATVPDGIVEPQETPTVHAPIIPGVSLPPDTITAKVTIPNQPQTRVSPTALSAQEPSVESPRPQQEPNENNQDGESMGANAGGIITAGSETMSITMAGQGTVLIGSKTITSGQTLTLEDGQVVSMDASAIHVGSSAIALSAIGASETVPSGIVITDAGGELKTVSEVRSGVFAIGTTTLSAGQDLTLSNGDVLHVNSNGVQFGSSTLAISALETGIAQPGFYVIDQKTLTPGGSIMDSTMTISLDDSGNTYYIDGAPTPVSSEVIVVDGTTYTEHTATSTKAVEDYIMQAISSAAARATSTATSSTRSQEPESETESSSSSANLSSAGVRGKSAPIWSAGGLLGIALLMTLA